MLYFLLSMTCGGCKSADQPPSVSPSVHRKNAEANRQTTPAKPAALGFRTGFIFPETTITLAQLTEESRSPDFVKRYLGKHITITRLVPTGGGEFLGCGPAYSIDDNNSLDVIIWYDGKPKYDKAAAHYLLYAHEDSIKKIQPLQLPFDACSRSVIGVCGYPGLKTEEPATCPFDFEKLTVSGVVSAITSYSQSGEIHLIPHGLSD